MYQIGHKKTTKWWIIVIVTLVLLIFLYFIGGLSWLIGIFTQLSSPIQGGLYQAEDAISDIKSKKELIKENQELKKKLEQLVSDTSQLKTLEIENQILRQQLNFLEGQPYDFVTARIISGTAQNNLAALIINRGSQEGIAVGCPVVTGEGILVGKVIETKNNISTLLLLTDSQSKIAATIQNQDQTIGVVEGEHGISIKMDMIPQDEKVNSGDIIITSGLQEKIPPGLLIGLVDKIDSTSSELFAKAYLYPLVDYNKLNIVTVLIP